MRGADQEAIGELQAREQRAHGHEDWVSAPPRKWKAHWASGELGSNPSAATFNSDRGKSLHLSKASASLSMKRR